MVLGQSQQHVWFYTDADDGILINELPEGETYEVIRHTVRIQYDKIFKVHVTIHDLIIRRHT